MHDFCHRWVIPENIHTLQWAASWNSKGEGFLDWNSEDIGEGGYAVWNSKHMGGFSSEFPEKIVANRLQKWDKEINQAGVLKHSLDE